VFLQQWCDGGRDGFAEQQRAGELEVAAHGLGEDLEAFAEFAELPGCTQGEAEQPAKGRPFAVPGTVGAFVVEVGGGQVQLGCLPGGLQGGAADEHGEHRVLFLRHGRGSSPAGGARLGKLGDFRAAQEQHVGSDLAGGVGHGGQGIAQRGDGEPVRVPRRGDGREAQPGGQTVRKVEGRDCRAGGQHGAGGEGAGGSPGLHRQVESFQPARGGGQPGEPLRGLEAEGERQRVLGQAAAHAERVGVPFREAGQRRGRCGQLAQQATDGVPGQQHEGRVEHILAGQRGVDGADGADSGRVQRPDLRAEIGQQRDHRVGAALGAHGDVREVVAAHVRRCCHHRGRAGRRQACFFQDRGPRGLDPEDGGEHRPVPGQRRYRGRRRNGTQQAEIAVQAGDAAGIKRGHLEAPSKSRNTVSSSPWSRRSQVRPPSASRRAISVLRRSGAREDSSGSAASASSFSGR
jgi:hypothetical protein